MTTYYQHASGHRAADVHTLSRQPREQQYEPRPCDVVEFEADERVQHVVLASPSAGMQAPDGGHRDESGLSATSQQERIHA